MMESFARLLLAWYREHGRSLPWRKENPSFYEVLVSETMLQQTRVDKVLSYYARFLQRFPTLQALASSSEEDVLRLWEGLGYYSRARNLRRAALALAPMDPLPSTLEELMALPGIGEYTAKALLSIHYHRPAFAVDGNLLRVHGRLQMSDAPLSLRRKEAESFFQERLGKVDPSDANQALMDLGELVCLPHGKPLCSLCPLSPFCRAHREGRERDYPPRQEKKAPRLVFLTVFLLVHDGKVALRKRDGKGLLSALYEFLNVEGRAEDEKTLARIFREWGLDVEQVELLPSSRHRFSHLVWEMTNVRVVLRSLPQDPSLLFVERERIADYPIPSAFCEIQRHR